MTKTTLPLFILLGILLAIIATFFFSFVIETRTGVFGFLRGDGTQREVPIRSELTDGEVLLLSDQLRQVRAEIEARKEELDRVRAELDSVRADLPGTGTTLDDLRWKVADLTAERDRLRPLEVAVRKLRAENAELLRRLEELMRRDPLEAYMSKVQVSRRIALEKLRSAIAEEFPDLDVVINDPGDALQFQGEALFPSGARTLAAGSRRIVERIAELIDETLGCYSLGSRSAHDVGCNPAYAVLDALQIEGHTDDVGSEVFNAGLASDRAVATYAAMIAHVPGLLAFRNLRDEPIMTVTSYGESRPIASNASAAGRATNRRIEIRFVMYTPSQIREIPALRARLTRLTQETEEAAATQ